MAQRIGLENHDDIHRLQRAKNLRPLFLSDQRPAFVFAGTRAGVTVDGDDQNVAKRTRAFQTADMTGMKKLEAAACEDDPAAVAF